MAFLSAFRAVEALLGTSNLRKRDIESRGQMFDKAYGTSFATDRWQSPHEVFSSKRTWWQYPELIAFYLDVRNAVAAHANPRPPFRLTEDQVLELQRLVSYMLQMATVGSTDSQ